MIVVAATVIGADIFAVPKQMKSFILIEVGVFLLIMHGIFFEVPSLIKITKILRSAIQQMSTIKCRFELPNHNDLRLFIF